jgi:hypothetical protein
MIHHVVAGDFLAAYDKVTCKYRYIQVEELGIDDSGKFFLKTEKEAKDDAGPESKQEVV